MEVILMQKVANLGNIGDKVKVKPGYGRNYLLPQGKAAVATATNLKKFEERRAELEKLAADDLASATLRAGQLENFRLSLTAKQTKKLVNRPLTQRKPVGYVFSFLDGYRPNVSAYLSPALRKKLAGLGRTTGEALPAGERHYCSIEHRDAHADAHDDGR